MPSIPAHSALQRAHRTRLMQIWRSAGWPCRDAIEIDLLAAGLVSLRATPDGHETLHLTEAGIQWLALARQQNRRALSAHDRLAERVALQLMAAGRIVWRELSLRARVTGHADERGAECVSAPPTALWADEEAAIERQASWRMARPDVFSVRNTSVQAYLQPVVHEVKATRADLLSDLRHEAKRQSYQWLCCECHYVFPAGVARPDEVPPEFGVWLLHGDIEHGQFELARPARHAPCELPFAVWLALAKATPWRLEVDEPAQASLDEASD
ncbi:MAG: hypothetical protein Q7V20_19220 [Aquabacterium sp.]|uniref:hypothetical protein n=1 Tax=Aquabacterium sp. TaxID=1872578 RepID=UPI00271E1DA2|nr:hypothetical protein [Aquabacterium sp.]MDO9005583.1 hypothetical protein [Aquabacterium sp.]